MSDMGEERDFDPSQWKIGAMYHVPWSPNPHRLEAIKPQHCQLHGEFIGYQLYLRKRRNSMVRPWGSTSVVAPSGEIILIKPATSTPRRPA